MERKTNDWLTSYLRYVDETEPAEMHKIWTAISTIASCLQRKCFFKWDKVIYPNLYVVLVGPAGCRKGSAMAPAAAMLEELGIKRAAEAITREALIRELRQASGCTIDPITQKPHMHASLTIASEELTVFLGYNNLTLIADLTDWYDCRQRWTYRTKNSGSDEILGVWVNLLGATTPDILQATLPQDAVGGGLTSRMIFVYTKGKGKIVAHPFLLSENEDLRLDLVYDLERINMLVGEFKPTPEFLQVFPDWYIQQHSEPPFEDQRFGGYMQRRQTHVLKLCMVMSASRGDDMFITKEDFERSLAILKETEKTMHLTFSSYGSNPNIGVTQQIMNTITTKKEITISSLLRMYMRDLDITQLNIVLETLERSGFCKVVRAEAGGDNRVIYTEKKYE